MCSTPELHNCRWSVMRCWFSVSPASHPVYELCEDHCCTSGSPMSSIEPERAWPCVKYQKSLLDGLPLREGIGPGRQAHSLNYTAWPQGSPSTQLPASSSDKSSLALEMVEHTGSLRATWTHANSCSPTLPVDKKMTYSVLLLSHGLKLEH